MVNEDRPYYIKRIETCNDEIVEKLTAYVEAGCGADRNKEAKLFTKRCYRPIPNGCPPGWATHTWARQMLDGIVGHRKHDRHYLHRVALIKAKAAELLVAANVYRCGLTGKMCLGLESGEFVDYAI